MVAVIAAVCSCAKFDGSWAFDGDRENVLIVTGTAYDSETLKPVQGIRIIMNSYETADTEKSTRIESDTTYTAVDGQYESVLEKANGLYYDIVAEDVDGKYQTSGFDHIVARDKTNKLSNQDIYLKKN